MVQKQYPQQLRMEMDWASTCLSFPYLIFFEPCLSKNANVVLQGSEQPCYLVNWVLAFVLIAVQNHSGYRG